MTEVTIYWKYQRQLQSARAQGITEALVDIDPANEYDSDARAVFMGGMKVGYLRKTDKAAWPVGNYKASVDLAAGRRRELACFLVA